MAYTTYTTDALVCGSRHHNTSDKSFQLFTRDAGMLFATARSVREERSKQRYALQDFTHARISIIKGKSGWKVGSAEALYNPFFESQSRKARGDITYIVKLLRRFLHGEEPNIKIFDDVISVFTHILTHTEIDNSVIKEIFTLRLLNNLGYVASDDVYKDFLSQEYLWSDLSVVPKEVNIAIEQALTVSHL